MIDSSVKDVAPIDRYVAGGVVYRIARAEDDAALREALRSNDMDSWVRMSTEREANYFDGENLMGESISVIAHEEKSLHNVVGMYSVATRVSHVNGIPTSTGYLGALRVNQRYRRKFSVLRNGFASIGILVPTSPAVWFTSIAIGNEAALRMLEANLSGMPRYRPAGDLETLAFSTQQGKNRQLLQPAQTQDIPALVQFFNRWSACFQFSAVLTEQWLNGLSGKQGLRLSDFWLLKNGREVRGCVAIWDQRAVKQIVARGYRFPLNLLRLPYNLAAGISGRLKLPKVGEPLQQVFLSFLALDSGIGDAAVDLVQEALALARKRGAQAALLGLSAANPLSATLKDRLHATVYRTRIETVTWPDRQSQPVDERPPQPEIAIL